MNKKAQAGAALILIVLAVLLIGGFSFLMAGFDTVDASHIGVKNRFGQIIGTMQPGMQWTGVFVHVEQYDLRTKQMTVEMMDGAQTAVDKDGQTVKARIQVNYRLNPENVIDAYSKVGPYNTMPGILNIEGIIREGFKTASSQYKSKEIWQKRGEVKEKAIEIISHNFPTNYFILENIIISDLDFNPAFIAAIELQKTNEELSIAKQKEVEIAKQEALRVEEEARGQAEKTKLAAEAEAYKLLKAAESEAKALELKREQLTPLMVQQSYIEAWKAGGAQVPKFVMSGNSGTNFLMQLPDMNEITG